MNILPILTNIEDGQSYVDEPIYSSPKKLNNAIRSVFGGVTILHICKQLPLWPEILVAYQHVKLNWMKPDGKGGLIPR